MLRNGFLCRLCGCQIARRMTEVEGEFWATPNPAICPNCGKDNSAEFREESINFMKGK